MQKVSKNLRNLDLSDNKIASVPRWIANFKALKTLNIKMNRLTQLPEEIGQLVKLETLVICGNLLNALPKSLSKLRSLREFDASHNQISTFPVTLSSLNNLDSVDLSSNKIKSIPDGVEELQLTILSLNQVRIEREHYFPREPSNSVYLSSRLDSRISRVLDNFELLVSRVDFSSRLVSRNFGENGRFLA